MSNISEFSYVFVKLINGENIICATFEEQEFDDDEETMQITLPVIRPVQVISTRIPVGESIVEKFMMQPWIPFCDNDEIFEIPFSSIVFIGKVSDLFVERYREFLEDHTHSLSDDMENINDEVEQMIVDEEHKEFNTEEQSTNKYKKWLH